MPKLGQKRTIEELAKFRASMLGHAVSQKTREKISKAKIGIPSKSFTKFKSGRTPWNKGVKGGIVGANKGRVLSEEWCKNISKGKTGCKQSEKQKEMMRARIGELNHRWIKDRSLLKKQEERNGNRHKEWSRHVKNRDGWKCKISNGDCSGRVVAHHILPWRDYVELRYEVNNGITLCHFHHPLKRNDEMRLSPYFQELVNSK